MLKIENETLQKFFNNLVDELKYENDERRHNCDDKRPLNIPFIVSTLCQSLSGDTTKYQEFVNDLEKYSDYTLCVSRSKNEWDGLVDIDIDLVKYGEEDENTYYCDYETPGYVYELRFSYDERSWGYCECTPDMKDYREDKHCCGHGCDAIFCSFTLHKVINIGGDIWEGDEHDYWKFEDAFYASDKELADKKAEEEKLRMIEELKRRIEADTKKLEELSAN